MFDELYTPKKYEWGKIQDIKFIEKIFLDYMNEYNNQDDKDTWFFKMKKVAENLGFAGEMKKYKENPDKYKGSIADFSTVLRVGLTSKSMTPDLYEIMKLFGKDKMQERFKKALENKD